MLRTIYFASLIFTAFFGFHTGIVHADVTAVSVSESVQTFANVLYVSSFPSG